MRQASSGAAATGQGWTLLANNIDTLEVSWFEVSLDPAEVGRLTKAKALAQAMPGDGPGSRFELAGETWDMRPSGGRRVQFILIHERGELAISTCAGEQVPRLRFKFYSETLWGLGLDASWAWMAAIVAKLHAPEGASEEAAEQPPVPRSQVSRVDPCADFYGIDFEQASLDEFVCRPRRKSRWKKLRQGWRRIPAGEEDDDKSSAEFWSGQRPTGLSFGKGGMSIRIYNKPTEIQDQSPDKVWLFGFWMKCSCCGEPANKHDAVITPKGAPAGKKASSPVQGYAGCEASECLAFTVDENGWMPERECRGCEGKGTVSAKIICKSCRNGKRKRIGCEACGGAGSSSEPRKCGECQGKKTTRDPAWRVEPQLRHTALLEFCKGVERQCKACSGLGEHAARPCKACRGAGSHSCLACRGGGARSGAPCARCDGTGERPCKKCGGSGERAATVCKKCQAVDAEPSEKGRGRVVTKPKPSELVDPRTGLVVRDGSRGALNVGEDLALPIDDLEGLKKGRAALWRYCVGGGQGVRAWLSWRIPNAKNSQRTRWKLRPEWAFVQKAPVWEGDTKDELVRLKRKRAKFKKILPGLMGYMSTAAALRTEADDHAIRDFAAAWELMYEEAKAAQAEREERNGDSWDAITSWKLREHGRWGLLGDGEMERLRGVPEESDRELIAV